MDNSRESTHVFKLTSEALSAVAVILVSGPNALEIILRHWRSVRSIKEPRLNSIYYGHWYSSALADKSASEDVVICRVADGAYEIHCHGGKAASERIVGDIIQSGASPCSKSFGRSYSNVLHSDSISASRQTALEILPSAKTQNVVRLILNQANGAMENAIMEIVAEGQTVEHRKELLQMIFDRWKIGSKLFEPSRVAILGPPNAGKSTLLNVLLGWERAIVHPTPGTTRDLLIEEISLHGWPLAIIDTAGLRDTQDEIERQGILKAMKVAADADLILLAVANNQGWTDLHQHVWNDYSNKTMIVITKCDLQAEAMQIPAVSSIIPSSDYLSISAKNGDGLDALITKIVSRLGFGDHLLAQAIPLTLGQANAILKAIDLADDLEHCHAVLASAFLSQQRN